MKLRTILERRGGTQRIPVEVVSEIEYDSPDLPDDPLLVTGVVEVEYDPYGTGDSPTEYEFIPTKAINQRNGGTVDFKDIPQSTWRWIEHEAISQARS